MSIIRTYRCDICGLQKRESNNWFLIDPRRTGSSARAGVTVLPFDCSSRDDAEIVHCCGIECLMKGVGRWASGASISGGSDQAA
jgi:hypothetical protein